MKREKNFFFSHNVKYCVTVCIGKEERKVPPISDKECAPIRGGLNIK